MSATTEPTPDLRAILARIDRDLAESAKLREESNKFNAEQHKLIAEQAKLSAEQTKLYAEANKLQRDWRLAPWMLAVSLLGGAVAAIIGQLVQHAWR